MIVERLRGKNILIRYRDEYRNRQEMRIGDIHPYCFVKDSDAQFIECYYRQPGYKGIYGESLTKVVFGDPADVGKLKKDYQTWEANIPFVNRVLVDKDLMIPNYEHRVWYLDMEWKTISGEITVITVHDTFSEKDYTWILSPDKKTFSDARTIMKAEHERGGKTLSDDWKQYRKLYSMPCENHPDGLGEIHFKTPALLFNDEKTMLEHFLSVLKKQDPDVITGWAVVWADIQQLAKRLKHNRLSPNSLSPLGRHRYDYGDWDQPIPGRLCIDLMDAWSRLWQLKNGKLPNQKLDTAAREALGERKNPLPDGHDTYYSDLGTYVDYNRQDVRLLSKLNSINNAIEHYLAVQHLVGCDFRATPFITKLFTVLALRDKEFKLRIPSKPQFEKEDYQGADIMEPVPGIYENIGIFDVRAMYHSNISKYGISWETIDENGQDIGNGLCFDTSKKGLLERQMDYMTELRDEYKSKMKSATTDIERRMYDSLQYATKSLVASMYGTAGDSRYGLYHPAVAAAITYTSRNTLGKLKDACEKRSYAVVYGHTDSVFVRVPSVSDGKELLEELNELLYPIVTEFEKWASYALIHRKNRYACNIQWPEEQIYIKGIEMKQSRMPQITKWSMGHVISMILKGQPDMLVRQSLLNVIEDIRDGVYSPIEDLFIRGKLDRDLDKYKVLSEARAAASWANKWLGKGYGEGSSFWVTLDSEGKYIAFDDPSEIEDIAEIGYKHIGQRFLLDKIKPYYHLAKYDFQVLLNEWEGKSSMEWL